MNFGEAVKALKAGRLVSRAGWNGEGMFLTLIEGAAYGVRETIVLGRILDPWIGMRTATGSFVPWSASQTDVLAEDWEVLTAAGVPYTGDKETDAVLNEQPDILERLKAHRAAHPDNDTLQPNGA